MVNGREIIFSKSTTANRNQNDIATCGTDTTPCSTLEFAIKISRTHDTIVFKCSQNVKDSCKYRLRKQIHINNKDLTIKGSEDNPQQVQLFLEVEQVFQLTGSMVKMRLFNIKVNVRWSVGLVGSGESKVIFERCQIEIKKLRYSLGMARTLRFFPVGRFARIKLFFLNSYLSHYKFNRLRVLNLVLADNEALSSEIYISKSQLSGNMMVTFKSDGTGSVRIIDSHFNSTAILIEGASKTRTWSTVDIRNTRVSKGHFSTQLKLSNLKRVMVDKVWVASENSDPVRVDSLDHLSIKNSHFPRGMTTISTVDNFEATKNSYTMSNLHVRNCNRVTLQGTHFEESTVTVEEVRFMQDHDGRYRESSLDLVRIKTFIVTSANFNTTRDDGDDKYTLLGIKDSHGVVRNTSFHQRQVRIENSHVTIMESRFKDNHAVEGGAIYNSNSTLSVENTMLINCSAKYFGGCIMNTRNGILVLKGVQMTSLINEHRHPTLFGGVIYSTSPVKLSDNVIITVKNTSTSSPIVYIKSHLSSSSCFNNNKHLSSIGQFSLTCPKDRVIKHDIVMNEQNDFCPGNLFDFLSISCVKCQSGFVNPLTPVIRNQNSSLVLKDNTCQSCTDANYEVLSTNQDSEQCPSVVPLITASPSCTNNHSVIYNPQCSNKDFYLSMMSNECIHRRWYSINRAFVFWGALIVLASLYAMVLMYIKEIVVILCIKQIYLQLKVVFEYFCSCCFGKNDKDYYESENDLSHSHRPDPMDEEFDLVLVHADQIRFTPLRFTMGTTTGVIKIIFFFYQIESLLRITKCPYKEQLQVKVLSLIRDTISSLFSLRLNYHVNGVGLIPWIGFTETDKEIMKGTFGLWLLVPVLCIGIGQVFCSVQKEHRAWREKNNKDDDEDEEEDRSSEEISKSEDNSENNYEQLRCLPGAGTSGSTCGDDMMPINYPPPKLKVQPMKYRFERIDGKVPIYVELPLKYRIKCFLLLLLTLLYLPISTFILKGIQCSPDNSNGNDGLVLDIENETKCYQGVQYVCMVLIAVWVVPFPLAVFFGSKLQYTCNINPTEFFVILLCPPTSVFFYLRARLSQYRRTIKRPDAILAKHMLMTLYESFRLQKVDKRFDVMWDVAFLAQKLGMIVLVVFAPEDYRLYLVLAFLALCTVIQFKEKPFNRDLTNRLQLVSLVALLLLTLINIFWQKQSKCTVDWKVLVVFQHIFLYLEYLVISAPVLIAVIGVLLAYVFAGCCMLISRRHRNSDNTKTSSVDKLDRGTMEESKEEWNYPGGEKATKDKSLIVAQSKEPKKRSVEGLVDTIDEDYHRSEGEEDESQKLVLTYRGQSVV